MSGSANIFTQLMASGLNEEANADISYSRSFLEAIAQFPLKKRYHKGIEVVN